MPVAPPMAKAPIRDNLPAGAYAIRVGQNQQIWRFRESDDPFSDDLEWERVGERTIDSVPKSRYDGGRWEADDDGDIWFYVEDIKPEKEPEKTQTQLDETPPYALRIRGSDTRPSDITGNTQADVFADTIEVLIEKYELNEILDFPFVPGYKNAVVNDEPRHPNGEEMERNRAIVGGEYYVSTQPTKDQKKGYLKEFEQLTGATITFEKGWED